MQGSPESGGIVCRIWKFSRESVFYRHRPPVACAGISADFSRFIPEAVGISGFPLLVFAV